MDLVLQFMHTGCASNSLLFYLLLAFQVEGRGNIFPFSFSPVGICKKLVNGFCEKYLKRWGCLVWEVDRSSDCAQELKSEWNSICMPQWQKKKIEENKQDQYLPACLRNAGQGLEAI